MPRDGTGNYTLPAGTPVVSGTVVSSIAFNSFAADVGTELTSSVDRAGRGAPTADLPMGGHNHTNVKNANGRTTYATAADVQDGNVTWCGVAGGTANAITLTPNPAITQLKDGQRFEAKLGAAANSGAVTVAISGLAAIPAVKFGNAALVANDLPANGVIAFTVNNGTLQADVNKVVTLTGSSAAGKSLTVNNTLTLAGTDGTTLTFPVASDTLVGRTSTDTLTNKTLTNPANVTQALVDAAPTTWDASLGAGATWTMAASRVLSAITNGKPGGRYVLTVTQGGAGGFAITWNAAYVGIKGAAMPQPNKKAGSVTKFTFDSPDGVTFYLSGPATAGPISVVVYTASGSDVIPAGATRAHVYVKGPGGSGGSGNSARCGGGGGEGEERWGWVNVTAGGTSTVTLNNGGASVPANNNTDGNSGSTSVWTDGSSNITANGGLGAQSGPNGGQGGNGGSGGSGGDYGFAGDAGQFGTDNNLGTTGFNDHGGGKGSGSFGGSAVANTGGGGGGGNQGAASGAGAKGIVIIEYWN